MTKSNFEGYAFESFPQFAQRFQGMYSLEIIRRLYSEHTMLKPLQGINHIAQVIDRSIEGNLYNGKLHMSSILKLLGVSRVDVELFAERFPDIAKVMYMIDQYGRAKFSGSSKNSIAVPWISSVADCLGIVIKDSQGNVTVQHINPWEQYSINEVVLATNNHLAEFNVQDQLYIAIAGMMGIDQTIAGVSQSSLQEFQLAPFTHDVLNQTLAEEFQGVNLKTSFYRAGRTSLRSMPVYDMITTTSPKDPILVRKLDLSF